MIYNINHNFKKSRPFTKIFILFSNFVYNGTLQDNSHFTWVLGLGRACAFAILNAMWHELALSEAGDRGTSEDAH